MSRMDGKKTHTHTHASGQQYCTMAQKIYKNLTNYDLFTSCRGETLVLSKLLSIGPTRTAHGEFRRHRRNDFAGVPRGYRNAISVPLLLQVVNKKGANPLPIPSKNLNHPLIFCFRDKMSTASNNVRYTCTSIWDKLIIPVRKNH